VSTAKPLHVIVPMPPNIGNGSHGHWAVRDKQRKAYLKALDMWQAAKRIPPPPPEPLQRATIDSVMNLSRMMDQDNAMRRHKWVLDWLKTRGYIADDSPKVLTWVSFPEQRVKMHDEYTIEITLRAMPL
jgi:hypothetical protein